MRRARLDDESPRVGILSTFGSFALPQWRALVAATVLVVVGTGIGLLRPWPLKFLFDDVLPGRTGSTSVQILLLAIAGAVVGIALLDSATSFVRQYLLKAAGQKVAFRVRLALYGRIQAHSLSFHDRQQTGDLITTVTKDVDRVQDLMTDTIVEAGANVLTLAGMVVVISALDWQLSLAMAALIPIMFFGVSRYKTTVKQVERHARRKEGEITSLAQQAISSIRLVKAYGREEYETARFGAHSEEALDVALRASRLDAAFGSFLNILTALGLAFLVWFGARRVLAGRLTPGELLVLISYMRDFYAPIRGLSRIAGSVSRSRVRAERIAMVLNEEPAVRDRPDAVTAPRLRGHIRCEHVTFSYLEGQPALTDIDFEVLPGQVLGLVGYTGAGKSTMAALIPRLYDPNEGRILVDGADIRSYSLASYQAQVSLVLQSSVLFRASVAENIAYGRPDASLEEIVAAARVANAHEFIVDLPDGYDTILGERGETISGGQRQRIAIARAVVRDAPILVLDEPTTGLDPRSEHLVLEALSRLMAGRTTIVISHKLSAVRDADVILFLERGRVVERGSYQELLDMAGGRFARLARLQAGEREDVRRPGSDTAAPLTP
jgi:ATP-binding cassette subfamily B protein